MKTGLPWRDGDWFVGQVDRAGVLSEPEQADVCERGDQWVQRTTEGAVAGDLYAASWAIVAALRERLQVEHREPPPTVEPADLDGGPRPNAVTMPDRDHTAAAVVTEPQVSAGAVYSSVYRPADLPPLVSAGATHSSAHGGAAAHDDLLAAVRSFLGDQ